MFLPYIADQQPTQPLRICSVNYSSMPDWKFTPELIAPCGMNCGICVAFFGYTMTGQRRKQSCGGCRSRESLCAFIKQRCDKLANKRLLYCFECAGFPCESLKTIDDRYRNKYGMSMIENLRFIQANGVEKFIEKEQRRWKCPSCSGTMCVHNKKCYNWNQTEKIRIRPQTNNGSG